MVDLLQGKKPISAKWIFKAKPGPSGTIDKLKARLVARGFEQTKGIDFFETFALVVRWSTIRSIVALAAQKIEKSITQMLKLHFSMGQLMKMST